MKKCLVQLALKFKPISPEPEFRVPVPPLNSTTTRALIINTYISFVIFHYFFPILGQCLTANQHQEAKRILQKVRKIAITAITERNHLVPVNQYWWEDHPLKKSKHFFNSKKRPLVTSFLRPCLNCQPWVEIIVILIGKKHALEIPLRKYSFKELFL